MNEDFYRQTSRVEDDHWWFRHRRRLARGLLDEELSGPGTRRGLDVGCGSGGNLDLLGLYCAEVVGLDRSKLALDLARRRGAARALVQGDANGLDDLFQRSSFGLITMFNVLYHRWIDDDRAVLRRAARLLRPGGCLLLTEPAFRILFRRHDRVDWGRRRYRLAELRDRTQAAGLDVVRASYFNAAAFPLVLALSLADRGAALLGRQRPEQGDLAEIALPHPAVNRSVEAVVGLEIRWLRRFARLPFGVSALILARKAP